MNCVECHKPLMSDGHGEWIHRDSGKYACSNKKMPDNRKK